MHSDTSIPAAIGVAIGGWPLMLLMALVGPSNLIIMAALTVGIVAEVYRFTTATACLVLWRRVI